MYRELDAAGLSPRTELQTESWRLLAEEWAQDASAAADCEALASRRAHTRPAVERLLSRFLAAEIGLGEFRAAFDCGIKTDWDAFGLRGSSGAMFLNSLVKHAAERAMLAEQLRAALRAPLGLGAAEQQLRLFVAAVPARHASRAVFFAGMCWHLQAPDRWPGYHPSARDALLREDELFVPRGDPVADYLAFRAAALSLAAALRLTIWQLEHLCWWHARRSGAEREVDRDDGLVGAEPRSRARRSRALRPRPVLRLDDVPARYTPYVANPATAAAPRSLDHTHVQWLLATLGERLGCRVWIAANDHRKRWRDVPLGALSVPRLPSLGLGAASQRTISLIDVVWLTGVNQVAAAFEVEHTTAVYSGLLRLADLAALVPNLSFPLYVVAPQRRLAKVRRELARPVFEALRLPARCGVFSSEALLRELPNIMRWGEGVGAIERLSRMDGGLRDA